MRGIPFGRNPGGRSLLGGIPLGRSSEASDLQKSNNPQIAGENKKKKIYIHSYTFLTL